MFGGSEIDTEHLLLGLIREGGTRAGTVLGGSSLTHDAVSRAVRERSTPGPKRPTSVDLPLSTAARRVLDCAGDDATRMGSPHVGTEHLLIGLLQQEDTLAFRLLDEAGVRLDKAREEARLRIHAKPAATLEGAPFAKLVYLLTRLDERRARYHVSAFGRDAIRVEVAVPGSPGWSPSLPTAGLESRRTRRPVESLTTHSCSSSSNASGHPRRGTGSLSRGHPQTHRSGAGARRDPDASFAARRAPFALACPRRRPPAERRR